MTEMNPKELTVHEVGDAKSNTKDQRQNKTQIIKQTDPFGDDSRMGAVEDEFEDKNGRKNNLNGRLGGVNRREAIDLVVNPPDQLQCENGEGKAESGVLQNEADESPSMPVAAVSPCTSAGGVALGFRRFRDEDPEEEKPK